ncbi:MAG: hypothetical protein WBM44_04785 [Waterburya sp.]
MSDFSRAVINRAKARDDLSVRHLWAWGEFRYGDVAIATINFELTLLCRQSELLVHVNHFGVETAIANKWRSSITM